MDSFVKQWEKFKEFSKVCFKPYVSLPYFVLGGNSQILFCCYSSISTSVSL